MAGSGSSGSSGPGGPRSKEQFANGIHHHYHLTLIIYYNPQKQLKLECIKHRSASKDKPPKLPPRDNSIYGPNHIPKVGNINLWKQIKRLYQQSCCQSRFFKKGRKGARLTIVIVWPKLAQISSIRSEPGCKQLYNLWTNHKINIKTKHNPKTKTGSDELHLAGAQL